MRPAKREDFQLQRRFLDDSGAEWEMVGRDEGDGPAKLVAMFRVGLNPPYIMPATVAQCIEDGFRVLENGDSRRSEPEPRPRSKPKAPPDGLAEDLQNALRHICRALGKVEL